MDRQSLPRHLLTISSIKTESIEESFHWWFNNLEYALVRTFPLPAGTDPQLVPNLSTIESFAPFWLLFVRIQVESAPERMQEAHAQLESARQALVGIFEFKIFDRRAFDTRIMEPRQA